MAANCANSSAKLTASAAGRAAPGSWRLRSTAAAVNRAAVQADPSPHLAARAMEDSSSGSNLDSESPDDDVPLVLHLPGIAAWQARNQAPEI